MGPTEPMVAPGAVAPVVETVREVPVPVESKPVTKAPLVKEVLPTESKTVTTKPVTENVRHHHPAKTMPVKDKSAKIEKMPRENIKDHDADVHLADTASGPMPNAPNHVEKLPASPGNTRM